MFRKMRRFRQQIGEEECVRILREQPRGSLPFDIPSWLPDRLDDPSLFCADGIHSNEAGHSVIAGLICRYQPQKVS